MSQPVCKIEDTFNYENLQNRGESKPDPCLEGNLFHAIPLDAVEPAGKPLEFDRHHVTWYANGFQWRPAQNEEIFNTYDYVIAVGSDLRKRFKPNTLVKITYGGVSVVARVVDRKPSDDKAAEGLENKSLDLSKAVAYALGGYELLQRGVVRPVTVEPVVLNCSSRYFQFEGNRFTPMAHFLSACIEGNHYLRLRSQLLKVHLRGTSVPKDPDPRRYEDIIGLYAKLSPMLGEWMYFTGYPPDWSVIRPHLSLVVRKETDKATGDTYHYLDLKLDGLSSAEEAESFRSWVQLHVPEIGQIVEGRESWPSWEAVKKGKKRRSSPKITRR